MHTSYIIRSSARFLFVLFLAGMYFSFSQGQRVNKIDSLKQVLARSSPDTNRIITLVGLCDAYSVFPDPDNSLFYGNQGLDLAKKLGFKRGVALCLNKTGVVYFLKGDYKNAITNYWQALKINEDCGNKEGVARNLGNIGIIYRSQGNFEKALKYEIQALKMEEDLGKRSSIAVSHINIGNIYFDQGNYVRALHYYQQARNSFELLHDRQSIATVLNNMGGIYFTCRDFDKSISYYKKSMQISANIGDQVGVAIDLNNIGQVYSSQGKHREAIKYYKKSLILARIAGARDVIKYDYEGLSASSEKRNDYKSAYEFYKLCSSIKDTLLNAQINKQMDEMAIRYETEKKERENALLKRQTTQQQSLNQSQRERLKYLVYGLILISAAGLLFFIRSYSRQKTNKFLKELVVLKTEEENELRKAKDAVEQSMKLKEQFLANISHEIRTPLNAIIGFTDLLHKAELGKGEKEYIHYIKTAGDNLVNIVNDILDMSKIEASMILLEEKPLQIRELFRSLQILFDYKAKEKNVLLSFSCAPSVPDYVSGDSTRLTQIFINLIGNALKFTERGSVFVKGDLLRQGEEEVILLFSVKDTGIGIPHEKQELIFERFTQAEADTTRKYGGTGLGLSIVKHLIELQNGHIQLSSEVGKGSDFSFTISLKPARELPLVEKKAVSEKPDFSHTSILLVEDNLLNVKLVQAVLFETGAAIEVAENGKIAIEKLAEKSFDLILMDMQMPEMDGYQATVYIRKKLKSNIPIIALTAHAMSNEREKCLQLGMNDYIPKPLNSALLFEKIALVTASSFKDEGEQESRTDSERLLNLNRLQEGFKIKRHVIKEMLEDFKIQMEDDLPLLKEAVSGHDYITIENISHKLKSPASIMGMSRIEKILVDIESHAISQDPVEKISIRLMDLQFLYKHLLIEIEEEMMHLS